MPDEQPPISHVRVQFARESFDLLGEIADNLKRIAVALEQRPAAAPARNSAGGPTFPNFGSLKGQPISGASVKDLRFYAHAAVRSLGDPSKARFHDKERANLAAYNAEIVRQGQPTQIVENPAPPAQDPRDEQVPQGGGDADGGPDSSDIPFLARETRLTHC